MNNVCDTHKAKPVKIYGACIGCEIESLKNEIKNKNGNFNAMVSESKQIIAHLTADVKLYRKELDEIEFANNEWKIADAQWKETVEQQGIYVHQLRGALGYDVPGHINENPDIKNGIAEALFNQIAEKYKEIRWLREEIEDLRAENAKLLASESVTFNENTRLKHDARKLREELEKYMKRVKILMDGFDKIIEGHELPVTIATESVAEAIMVRTVRE